MYTRRPVPATQTAVLFNAPLILGMFFWCSMFGMVSALPLLSAPAAKPKETIVV